MPRLTLTVVVTAACLAHSVHARAQVPTPTLTSTAVRTMAASGTGRISGLVQDAAGQPIPGVAVLAVGDVPGSARTDRRGRFVMALPAGAYVLRAAHDGYLSTYREALLVRSKARLERNITMVRIGAAAAAIAAPGDPHAHSETAWRLRRLTRTILRDTASGPDGDGTTNPPDATRSPAPGPARLPGVPADGALANTARAAASFLAGTDFTGQLHFVTATQRGDRVGRPEDSTRGIASVAVGAAVGRHGNWRVRGAVAPGDQSSWGLDGEYAADPGRTHAFRVGVSYGTQGDAVAQAFRRSAIPEARSLGVVYGQDRWRVGHHLTVDYGLRFDRADYTAQRGAISPDLSVRWRSRPSTTITAAAAWRAIVPGAIEFIGPMSDGPWLPPARTFSSLTSDAPLEIGRRSQFDVGVEQRVWSAPHSQAAFSLRAFRQHTDRQSATLFGLDDSRGVGHYYIAPVGPVSLMGWEAGLSTDLGRGVLASAAYTRAQGAWGDRERTRVRDLSLSVGRTTDSTSLSTTYRLTHGHPPTLQRLAPSNVSRFDVELRQVLPYQPIQGGRLAVVFSVRNLIADDALPRSAHDESLVMSPPVRVLAGVQVRF